MTHWNHEPCCYYSTWQLWIYARIILIKEACGFLAKCLSASGLRFMYYTILCPGTTRYPLFMPGETFPAISPDTPEWMKRKGWNPPLIKMQSFTRRKNIECCGFPSNPCHFYMTNSCTKRVNETKVQEWMWKCRIQNLLTSRYRESASHRHH